MFSPASAVRRPPFGRRTHPGTQVSGRRTVRASDIADMSGAEKIHNLRVLLDTDHAVRQAWRLVQSTLLSPRYEYEASGPGPLAEELATWARECIGIQGHNRMMARPFERLVGERLPYIHFGYSYGEIEWFNARSPSTGKWRTYVRDVHDCDQSAHDGWDLECGRTLRGIYQRAVLGQTGRTYCERDKLWLMTFDQVGSDPEGLGLGRPCWFWYQSGKLAAESGAIAIERVGTPALKVRTDKVAAEEQGLLDQAKDEDGQPLEGTLWDGCIEDGIAQAENWLAHESSYVFDNPAVDISIFEGSGDLKLDQILRWMDACDARRTAAWLTGFLLTSGTDARQGAAQAGDEVQAGLFRRAAVQIAEDLATEWDRQVMAQAIEFGFGRDAVAHAPRLVQRGLDTDALIRSLNVLPDLKREGFVPNAALAVIARRILDAFRVYLPDGIEDGGVSTDPGAAADPGAMPAPGEGEVAA